MRRVVLGAMSAVLISNPAIAAKYTMQLNAGPQQVSRMESGVAAVDDFTAGSSVRLVQSDEDVRKRGSVGVLVMNHGDKPFNFGTENISATLADGTPVQIITYEQLAHEERRRETWAAIAVGLGAVANSMNAANAGHYHGTMNYSGTTFGSFGNSTTFGSASFSGYNAGQAAIAQSIATQQNAANFDRLAQQNSANRMALKSYMRTTTVDPQQMFGGSVLFQLPKQAFQTRADVPVTFVVTIDGEQHRFQTIFHRR